MENCFQFRLDELALFNDNWDGEGAPAPTSFTLEIAKEVIKWANKHNLLITQIDPDVLGGVAIWFEKDIKKVWFSFKNSGDYSIVFMQNDNIDNDMFCPDALERVIDFLN